MYNFLPLYIFSTLAISAQILPRCEKVIKKLLNPINFIQAAKVMEGVNSNQLMEKL